MQDGRGQGFGRRRGMGGGIGRNTTMVRDIFGWIKSQIHNKNSPEQSVVYKPESRSPSQVDEQNRLKDIAQSMRSQLDVMNARIDRIENASVFRSAHINRAVCNGCGQCVSVCPQSAISLIKHSAQVDRNKCTACEICVSECPVGAIDMID